MTDQESRERLFDALVSAIQADRHAANKWDPLYLWFQQEFGQTIGNVAGKLLTENKQLSNRLKKELPQLSPRYIVLCSIGDDYEMDAVERHLRGANLPDARCVAIFEGENPVASKLIVYNDDGVSDRLSTLLGLTKEHGAKPHVAGTPARAVGPIPPAINVVAVQTNPVIVPDRVRRMVVRALMSAPAVLLVGPPGTGKTTLLSEILAEIRGDSQAFGLTVTPSTPKWVTPEESWTTADLVGGETVHGGDLRFRPGHVLEAIRENRWLVIDEANRADLDKILGGLLTWLEGQAVELGPATRDLNAPAVVLEWGAEAECTFANLEALDGAGTNEPVRFVAGNEWKLLGTYNALDAQRVFRFGQAVARRFVRVPIPTPEPEQFDEALKPLSGGLPVWVHHSISKMYKAHRESPRTELGPALFLRIPSYLLASPPEVADAPTLTEEGHTSTETDTSELGDGLEPPQEPQQGAESPLTNEIRELLSEAYLVNVGGWIATLEEEDREALGTRLVVEEAVFSDNEWSWIAEMARSLG